VNNGLFSRERAKWLTMDALCHAKFANHRSWFDALALIM